MFTLSTPEPTTCFVISYNDVARVVPRRQQAIFHDVMEIIKMPCEVLTIAWFGSRQDFNVPCCIHGSYFIVIPRHHMVLIVYVYYTFWSAVIFPLLLKSRWLGTPKRSVVDRSAQTRQVQNNSPRIHLHAPQNPTCSR